VKLPYPKVTVSRRAAGRIQSGSPWIYESDVELDTGNGNIPHPGSVVQVVDHRQQSLGMAHFSSSSQIKLRMLDRRTQSIDADFYQQKIRAAKLFRQRCVAETEAFRCIHAEADGLPGLIVDQYGDQLSVQALTQGMDSDSASILPLLQAEWSPNAIVLRNDAAVREKENLPRTTSVYSGEVEGPVRFQMNGFRWQADLLDGQKTGGFLDQRENYLAVEKLAHGKQTALDCYTNSGGFAIHLSRAGLKVDAADASAKAISAAEENAKQNGQSVAFKKADVSDLLRGFNQSRRQFDVIVLDPPAFAKSRSAVAGALKAYYEINQRALRMLNAGGILVSCSCSQLVSEADLLGVIQQAASDSGKFLRVLSRRTQSADHPILLAVPETHYLKCLIFEVLT
jgi:23S rRNA (cytosine1962-C5)-methyltransferase